MKKIVFYLSLFIITWVYCAKFNCIDWDLWARLAVGKIFFLTGTILKHDIFAYTPVKSLWIDHEWGSGVIFYYISHYFGDTGLMLLKIFFSFIILFIISRIVKLQNPKTNAHLNIGFYAIVYLLLFSGIGTTVRCQHFTFLFFTLLIYLLERIRRNENKLLFIIPPLMMLWANIHGGFVSGLGLLLIYGIGEFLNKKPCIKYFIVLIPSVLITLINPYGINYWFYMAQAITMKRTIITEWLPTNLMGSILSWQRYKLVLLVSAISIIFTLIKNRPKYRELDKVKYLILLVSLYLSLKYIKHQPFLGIAAGCFLYHDFYNIFYTARDYIVSVFGEIGDKFLRFIATVKDVILYTFIFIAGSLLIYSNSLKITVSDKTYPVGSIEFISQNHLSGNLLTVFHWGSYAFWKLYPECLIAYDGRYEEVYPDETVHKIRNFLFYSDKKSYDFIKKYNTDILVLEKNTSSYVTMLKDKNWKLIFEDKISGVFVQAKKAKKHYIKPVYTEESIIRDKYKSSININTLRRSLNEHYGRIKI
ncbi:MAG: hypothetical protein PHC34_05580 [Candidatus Gastranaerophilales bacterium]|nr:hypothetical protein [Candidatus Gastranaerophilales bacterium]